MPLQLPLPKPKPVAPTPFVGDFNKRWRTEVDLLGQLQGPALDTAMFGRVSQDLNAPGLPTDMHPYALSMQGDSGKYLMTSALQKAIRRGEEKMAGIYARTLHAIDTMYFWRRIPVVAIEDVGIAEPLLVLGIMHVCGKHKLRETLAPDVDWAVAVACALARACKDRTCCDLVVAAESDPDLADFRHWAFHEATGKHLHALVTERDVYLLKRMIALWALAGTKRHRGENVPEKLKEKDEMMGLLTASPYALRFMMIHGGNKTQDAMPLAWTLLLELAQQDQGPGGFIFTAQDTSSGYPPIRHVPSYTFDQHTGLGRKALDRTARMNPAIKEFLDRCGIRGDEPRMKALGSVHFRVEANALRYRLSYKGAEDIYDLCETARFRFRGIPSHMVADARRIMEGNMDWFDHARRFIAGVTVPGQNAPTPMYLPDSEPLID